jgi:hypothetical protein
MTTVRLAALTLTFIAGTLVGAAALSGYWYWLHRSSEVWVATQTLQSADGMVVPAGTELVLETWMPEGFAALRLGINVEGETLDLFERRRESASFLRIPYFLYGDSE